MTTNLPVARVQMSNVLAPYRVLDLTDAKGFLCGKILGDLGADVIKIETPGGETDRNIGPFYHDIADPEKSLYWYAYNTSKRSITLNIETRAGKDLFKRLVKTADFVIESFRPGYLAELGLDYAVLADLNPRVIVTSITPFGQTGPYKDYKSSDLVASAMGGLVYICGDRDRPPVRITAEQAYPQAAVQAAGASLIALYYRERTGTGQHVDVSIEEAMAWTTCYTVPSWFTGRRLYPRTGGATTRKHVRYRLLFACKDGYISTRVGVGLLLGPAQARLVRAMADEDVVGDLAQVDWKALSIDDLPQEDIDRWEEAMLKYFRRHTKAELQEEAARQGWMLFPVTTPTDILAYRQLAERDFWVAIEHPELDESLYYPGYYFKLDSAHGVVRFRAPLIGEHNEEIYQGELGLSKSDLLTLKEANVI